MKFFIGTIFLSFVLAQPHTKKTMNFYYSQNEKSSLSLKLNLVDGNFTKTGTISENLSLKEKNPFERDLIDFFYDAQTGRVRFHAFSTYLNTSLSDFIKFDGRYDRKDKSFKGRIFYLDRKNFKEFENSSKKIVIKLIK